MADLIMTALTPEDAAGRTVIKTGISTVGQGEHNYLCGHCGRQIMHKMDVSNFKADVVFQCSSCEGFNLNPSLNAH